MSACQVLIPEWVLANGMVISTRVGWCEHHMKEISPWRIERTSEPVEKEYVSSAQREEAHLRDYWKMLVKRRRLVLGVFVVVFGFGAYIISSATPMYTASATIRIEPQNPAVIRIEEIQVLQVSTGDYYQTQFSLLKSRPLAAKVIAELDLASNRAFTSVPVYSPNPISWLESYFSAALRNFVNYLSSLSKPSSSDSLKQSSSPIQKDDSVSRKDEAKSNVNLAYTGDERTKLKVNPGYIGRYLRFLKVEPVRNTRLVQVVFTTPDPELSQQLANAHADAFIRMNLETRFEVTKEARKFLEKKLSELRSKVVDSEAELSAFRKANGVVSMDKSENLVVDRMIDLNKNLTAARIKRIELESLRQMVENKNALNLSEIINNAAIQGYRGAIESLEAEQVKLSTVFTPDHPRMVELRKRVSETRQRMNLAVAEIVRRIDSDYVAARNKEQTLDAEARRQREAAIDLKGLGVNYTVLQGEADSNRKLYDSVLTRLSETSISSDLPVSNMQITEMADTPGGLSSVGEQLKFLVAITGGALFLALGLAFSLAYFDSTLGTPEEVWHYLYRPTLGVVPDLKSLRHRSYSLFQPKESVRRLLSYFPAGAKDSESKNLTVSHDPLSMVSEVYRAIRTTLLFSQPEKPPQTILFTSPCPGEGKTITTLNLAITLAQGGKSVLVIDADMRKGRCHHLLRRQNHKGLSNVLTGNLTLEEGVQEAGVPGLSLLSRGLTSPNPTDLLGSAKMMKVLDALRKRFEFILIDTSPVIGVSDAEVVSQFCDGVVLVIHGQSTSRFSARQALERLEAVRARVIGVVLNGVDLRSPDYASYRYYYASYYASSNGAEDDGGSEQSIVNPPDLKKKNEMAWPTQEPTGSAPKHFFDRITLKLIEAAGPMAPIIIQDQVALLGESLESFPQSRLKELCDEVSREILDEELRNSFQKTMTDYIRAL